VSDSRRTPDAATPRAPARHASPSYDPLESLGRRVSLPTVTDASAPQMLRAASIPLVAAALVATANTSAVAAPIVGLPTHQQDEQATYTVKEGDTVAEIAALTKIGVQDILRANKLPPSGLIHPGQRLILPGRTSGAPAKPVKPATQNKPAVRAKPAQPALAVHVVMAGDSVADIAADHKISVASVIAANRLGPNGLIHPGQRLTLPGVRPPTPKAPPKPAAKPAPPPTRPYTVNAGDSLYGISASEKVPIADVLRLNRLRLDSVIHPGQKLLLPGAPPSAVPNTFLGRRYPDAVARAAAANRAVLADRKVPSRDQMRALVARTASAMGVDPALALAVAYQESGFNQRAVSPANAIGTMQVIPGTGRWASDLVGRRLDLLDPEDNVTAGVAVLAALQARAEEKQAIAGYYQGLASVQARGMYEDTKDYVASVRAHRAKFAKELSKD
jgi:LysM repeat protein